MAGEARSLTRYAEDKPGSRRMLITCPRCEEEQDVLAFKQLEQPVRFRKLLNPILKCLACKHVFSPRIFS